MLLKITFWGNSFNVFIIFCLIISPRSVFWFGFFFVVDRKQARKIVEQVDVSNSFFFFSLVDVVDVRDAWTRERAINFFLHSTRCDLIAAIYKYKVLCCGPPLRARRAFIESQKEEDEVLLKTFTREPRRSDWFNRWSFTLIALSKSGSLFTFHCLTHNLISGDLSKLSQVKRWITLLFMNQKFHWNNLFYESTFTNFFYFLLFFKPPFHRETSTISNRTNFFTISSDRKRNTTCKPELENHSFFSNFFFLLSFGWFPTSSSSSSSLVKTYKPALDTHKHTHNHSATTTPSYFACLLILK